jgi:hypothetical protein
LVAVLVAVGCDRGVACAIGWLLLSGRQDPLPVQGKVRHFQSNLPLRRGESVDVLGLAPEDTCSSDMLVLIRWQGRNMAVPLSQLTTINPDESTCEAIKDWHYWVAQGYCF